MTIPLLTTANTFQEWMNDTQQLIVLMNLFTDGPQVNANTKLVLSTLNVGNINFGGASFTGINTSIVPEGTNLYLTAARIRANVSNSGVAGAALLYDQANGIFTHSNSAVTPGTYANTLYVPVITVDQRGHVTGVVNTAIDFTAARALLGNSAPILYNPATGVFSHGPSGVSATTYGNNKFVAVVTVDANGHATSVSNVAIDFTQARTVLGNTSPIFYDPATGIISHNVTPATATTYGNATYVPSFTLGPHGHISAAANTLIDFSQARSQFSNVSPIKLEANGLLSHAVSGVVGGNTTGNTKFTSTITVDAQGHVTAASNTAIDYIPARLVIAATLPIVWDSGNGILSHATSGAAAGSYGSTTQVAKISVDSNGHVTLVSNVAIDQTRPVYRNSILVATRKGLNFIQGANTTLTINDDAANDTANITIAATGGGGGVNPEGTIRVLVNNTIIAANSNSINFLLGPGVNVFGNYDATGATEVEIYLYANNAYDTANIARLDANSASFFANTNATAAKIRANVSNTAPINYDSLNGIFSHALSGVTANGYGSTTQTVALVIDNKGHITSAANAAIDYTGARTVLANTAPINYDPATGTISHALSAVTPTGYGDSVNIPAVVVDNKGHVTSIVNTAVRVASTTQTGIVRLDDSILNTTSTFAATSLAVNTVFQNSQSQFANTWLAMTRQLQQNVDDFIEIGNFNSANGAHNFLLSAVASLQGTSIAKTYAVSIANNLSGVGGAWIDLRPLSSSGSYNGTDDFAIDANTTRATTFLRLRKTLGANVGLVDIKIYPLGPLLSITAGDVFTSTSATGNTPLITGNATPWFANANNMVSGQLPDARLFSAGGSVGTFANNAYVAVLTVDAKGRVTAVVNTAIDFTQARSKLANTTPINYDPASGTISHALSGVTAKTYGDTILIPAITVDSNGHVTSVTNNQIRLATTGQFGAVMLEDSIISVSTSNAATPASVNTVNNLVRTIQAGLGPMSAQDNNNVVISGGVISNTKIDATRVVEGVATYTPVLNANVEINWGTAGGSRLVCNGINNVHFSNIVAGTMGHVLETSNLDATTFRANANVTFGVSGKPAIPGKAVLSLTTMNAGVNVYTGIMWRAV